MPNARTIDIIVIASVDHFVVVGVQRSNSPEHINVAVLRAQNAPAPNGRRVAGAQLRPAQRAREAADVKDELAGAHHQLGGAQPVSASVAATCGE